MKTGPPRPKHYFQVRYAPLDKTRETRDINATTILAFFTDIASLCKALPFASRSGYIRFAKVQRAMAWSDLFSTGIGGHKGKFPVESGKGCAHNSLCFIAAAFRRANEHRGGLHIHALHRYHDDFDVGKL